MASLNTLRTKGGWFLTIVIGLALVAFIFTDLGSCRGGQNPVVGEINGQKINYTDFQQARMMHERALNPRGSSGDNYEEVNNRTWGALIMQHSYMPGFENLGLAVSQPEQFDMAAGAYISPVVQQFFANPETGMYDPAYMSMMIGYLRDNGDETTWPYIEMQMNEERIMSKYAALAGGGMMISDVEVRNGMKADNMRYDARVIFRPYSDVTDEEAAVSSADIKKYYNEHKKRFERKASRDIEYVMFDIKPSAEDMAEGRKKAEEMAADLAAAPNPSLWIEVNSPEDKNSMRYMADGLIDATLREEVLGKPEAVYGPVLNGETYTMSRFIATRMIPDSVDVSVMTLSGNDQKLADSLMTIVNGDNFAELARTYSGDNFRTSGGELGWQDPALYLSVDEAMGNAMVETAVGRTAKIIGTQGNIHLIHVRAKTAPVSKSLIATARYTIIPSPATQVAALNSAREFYAVAQGSYDNFSKAASEMALPKRMARFSMTDREIDGIENSLGLLRWAFDSKKGTVDEPRELDRDHIVVAVVTGETEDGVAPLEAVTAEIRELLVQRRKGEILAAQMTGSTLDQVAAAHSLEVQEVEDMRFAMMAIPGLGTTGIAFEPRLVGAVCNTGQTGTLSAPVKGNNGVYMFEVTEIRNTEDVNEMDQRVRLESAQQYMMGNLLQGALYEKSNIKDYRTLYF